MHVGFVGLGTMGGRMVHRLIGAGYTPVVYDRIPALIERLTKDGATAAASIGEVVDRVDVVLSSLPMPADVEAVYTGPDGALGRARSGQVFADLSTIDPATARRLAETLEGKGVAFLDAPVSGGQGGAETGTLAIMVGGDAAALERIRPILAAFSSRVFHVGPVGAGSVAKLANQLLVGANTLAALEATAFAAKAGIAPALLLEILSSSAGDSVMLRRNIHDFVLTGNFAPQFALRLLVKDLRLYQGEATSLGTATPSGETALSEFERALAAGLGNEDYAAVLKIIAPELVSSTEPKT